MLAHAASQANAGGSLWYANIKATQELAKNAFDAINNRVVFAP
jgi:nucleoside-diphosphate-sugar epimerase